MKKTLLILSSLIICNTYADNLNSNFKSSANLAPSCRVNVSNLSFGTFIPSKNTDSFSSTNVSLVCSKDLSFTLYVDRSSNYAVNNNLKYSLLGTDGQPYFRVMSNGSDSLLFNLYKSPNYINSNLLGGSNWGLPDKYLSLIGKGNNQNIPIYAALDGNQFIKPGFYSETATLVLSF